MSNLRAAFGDIKKSQKAQPVQTELETAISLTPPPEKPRAGRAVGKSANPDYERMTVYVRKETKKAAERKCEDEGKFPDVSELVQSLLTDYLNS
jgi:hypothetical protein